MAMKSQAILALVDDAALALAVGRDLGAGDRQAAQPGLDGGDGRTGIDVDPGGARLHRRARRRLGRASTTRTPTPALQRERGEIGVVIVGEDHAVGAGRHAVARDQRPRRRSPA